MTPPAIAAWGLTKRFRTNRGWFRAGDQKLAVDDVSLEIPEGELFVLLGRNGAGKTTFVKMLATLVLANSGRAEVFGHDVEKDDDAVRRLIGYASPEERSFFWRLSGRDNLEFFAGLHGLAGAARKARLDELVEDLLLGDFIDRRFDGYSSGMKQRVALARGLLGQPRLLILDEPTRSLDPAAQLQTRTLIHDLSKKGLTLLLVTHQLDEARELGDRIGFMDAGRLRVYGRGEINPADLFAS